ncbi:hypothetical protein SESBI_25166 [Sesbania bispinosa]|nr:hypothetical protein SESBI_25166 [Sesbania bispinosa]
MVRVVSVRSEHRVVAVATTERRREEDRTRWLDVVFEEVRSGVARKGRARWTWMEGGRARRRDHNTAVRGYNGGATSCSCGGHGQVLCAIWTRKSCYCFNECCVITGLGPDFTKMESFGKVDEFAETLVGSHDWT